VFNLIYNQRQLLHRENQPKQNIEKKQHNLSFSTVLTIKTTVLVIKTIPAIKCI